ncbi:MAG: DciA family protein [Endomicrobiia bacterium]
MEHFSNIKPILQKILNKYGICEDLTKIYIVWEEVVGKKIAKKIELCGLKGDTLLVKVNSHIYRHHLKLLKKEWLKKINLYLDENLKEPAYEGRFKDIKIVNL